MSTDKSELGIIDSRDRERALSSNCSISILRSTSFWDITLNSIGTVWPDFTIICCSIGITEKLITAVVFSSNTSFAWI